VLRESGRAALRWWRRWPGWVGYVAAAWSLACGLLGLYWTLGGAGFPLGSENDSDAALSILGGVRAGFGAPVIVALGLAGQWWWRWPERGSNAESFAWPCSVSPGSLRRRWLCLSPTIVCSWRLLTRPSS
jgi:hypothetical protein